MMQALMTLGYVPGCPAAGHMDGGYWHPGPKETCLKGNCPRKRIR